MLFSPQKTAVTSDNMTDSDKLELQKMLKESQEELERLWHHNKIQSVSHAAV
jgi:hypothetical protein